MNGAHGGSGSGGTGGTGGGGSTNSRKRPQTDPVNPSATRPRLQNGHANGHRATNASHNQSENQSQAPRHEFHSFMGFRVKDDTHEHIKKWIFAELSKGKDVEIEMKVGHLLLPQSETDEKGAENRLGKAKGIETVAVVNPEIMRSHFKPGVDGKDFLRLNKLLNAWCTNSQHRPPHLQNVAMPLVKSTRVREIDKLYPNKVRVTLDTSQPNRMKECIRKEKHGQLNIVCPQKKYDLRFTAAMEHRCPRPEGQAVNAVRVKDRISYRFDRYFSIDISTIHMFTERLTPAFVEELRQWVEQSNHDKSVKIPRRGEKVTSYEVEIEVFEKELFYNERQILHHNMALPPPQRRPHKYLLIAACFITHAFHIGALLSLHPDAPAPMHCRQ